MAYDRRAHRQHPWEGPGHDPRPGIYVPYGQRPETATALAVARDNLVLLARHGAGIESVANPLRRAIWAIDPDQPVPDLVPLERIVSAGASAHRFRAVLLGAFATLALALVIAGIYGVIKYLVAERTHEFGIRMAIGATRRDIVASVLTWGLRLTAIGVALGVVGALLAGRYLASLLFDVAPRDPLTLLASVAAIVFVAFMASLLPAHAATRVDPMIATQSERPPARKAAR